MPRNPGIPRPERLVKSKSTILEELEKVDSDPYSRKRVLEMENEFRARIDTHVSGLPAQASQLRKFNTSPFVLMMYSKQRDYNFVSQIENDILPAKLFSSMETSAGRMVETVVFPVYKWENVQSSMHSASSAIDGRHIDQNTLKLATLKSGPRCLNDEMSKDIATDIVENSETWAKEAGADHIDFTYGVLYGTQIQSNKKDWHILRNIEDMIGPRHMIETPTKQWNCSFRIRAIRVDVSVRIGIDWWIFLGGNNALLEMLCALIRACINPTLSTAPDHEYVISDLEQIVTIENIDKRFNISILQKSQLPWLFFLLSHYVDSLID